MKVFNQGKAEIRYGFEKDDVLVPKSAKEVSSEVGERLMRLYPETLINMEKVTEANLGGTPVSQPDESEAA